jgi:hypothetical protein
MHPGIGFPFHHLLRLAGIWWREITRKCAIKIAIKQAYAWNWDRKGSRNLCNKPSQQNQVHEHQCIEKNGKNL